MCVYMEDAYCEYDPVEIKVRNSHDETQGIRIRRRPPTGPPLHYVGPFEFRLQNVGNTPRNILEEIVWNKDAEVAQVEIAKTYEKGGAACLSVLTDAKYFQGSFENLEAIRNAVPLLCKEFIVDAWQLYYARSKGADAVLLIVVLPDLDQDLISFVLRCMMRKKLDRIIEIDGIQLIGINNRNLETFEVDICNTKKLLEGERGEKIRQKDIVVRCAMF
ncbi:hypothetical protein R6Q57_028731 [Mikania cordata]